MIRFADIQMRGCWGESGISPQSDGGGGRIRTSEGYKPADLQSAPFGRSGTPPGVIAIAGDGIRTRDLLLGRQELYH